MRYDLARLGPHEFEHLSQALTIAVLGPAVSIFGAGPDGGREATWSGTADYPDPVPDTGRWVGAGVLQAKFKQSIEGTASDTRWLTGELRKELRVWADEDSARRKRGRLPDYLIVTTNVTLSPDPQRGGIDRVERLVASFADELGLCGWAVWHQDQLSRLLDVHHGVRRTYRALITPGDVLGDVDDALQRLGADEVHSDPLGDLLARRAARELSSQRWVRLQEAGHPTNQKLNLSDVAVDLPARPRHGGDDTRIAGIVAHLVEMGDEIRRPQRGRQAIPNVALVGGPGQGKTTLGQLLCQAYRTTILERREPHTLGLDLPELVQDYRRHLDALRVPVPRCPRWPARVVLSDFADALAGDPALTLLGYIASQSRDVSPINSRMMKEWLREWPWLLVLDGLDEVADPDNREKALTAIEAFQLDAANLEADLLVVATTRPQGYREELPSKHYQHFELDLMATSNALEYSKHLVEIRFANDPDMRERVLHRLQAAAAETQTARLMQTPLQVTIMSILLERRPKAPRDRFGLFEAYYRTLYEREVAKGTSISRLLDDHRNDVDVIHDRVGLMLQQRAQHAGEAEARLPGADLHAVALARLLDEEHPATDAERLATELASAATDRLVMLVGRSEDHTVGFDVRSLQELMAARSLFHDGDERLIRHLQAMAPAAHWRNTWLLAVSRIFAEREPLRDNVTLLLRELDSHDPLSQTLRPGARLALELLDDGLVVTHPKFRRLLLTHALDLLRTSYPGATMTALARVTHEACTQDVNLSHTVLPLVNAGLSSRRQDQVAALDFLAAWEGLSGPAAISARSRLDGYTRSSGPGELEPAIASLRAHGNRERWLPRGQAPHAADQDPTRSSARAVQWLKTASLAEAGAAGVEAFEVLRSTGSRHAPETAAHEVQAAIAAELADVGATDWPVAAELEDRLIHRLSRQTLPDLVWGDPIPPSS